ncbi:CD2 antigen cytoplasmic tail-binding, putative [Babesia ovis]|uniref:CD2 antigen cytoplasmic tail-binding, putative n=1 Tax=Babesia ovis TaxID=5869 RepID=A0A9W5WU18_BABOV|nr:CD2 antigen cytoplasmic tail-binding, putative [Babesia ovis]
MYLPHEINKIKDRRRLKRLGIDDDAEIDFDDQGTYAKDDIPSDADRNNDETSYGENDGASKERDEIPIEPFNMRKEMAEGVFDDEGTYVEKNVKMTSTNRSLNRDEGDDPWIAALEEQEQLGNKGDYSEHYKKRPQRHVHKPDLVQQLEGVPLVDVIKRLIHALEPGETPVDALKIHTKKKRELPGFKRKADVVDKKPIENPGGPEDSVLEKMDLSDLAHVLTVTWQNVYYMTKEDIQAALLNARGKATNKQYQFRWIHNAKDTYGPNSDDDIWNWIVYDYVSDGNPIEVRELGPDGEPLSQQWTHYKHLPFYTFMDNRNTVETNVKTVMPGLETTGDDSESDIDDGTFAKKQRKTELIGIKQKEAKLQEEDSQGSDDEPDVE